MVFIEQNVYVCRLIAEKAQGKIEEVEKQLCWMYVEREIECDREVCIIV